MLLEKSFFDTLALVNQCLASSEVLIKENLVIPGEGAEDVINRRVEMTPWKRFLINNYPKVRLTRTTTVAGIFFYKDNVVLEYGGGALGRECFVGGERGGG